MKLKKKLKKTDIDKMVYSKSNGQRDIRWDIDLVGFGIRIYPPIEGVCKKSYLVSYRINGRQRLFVIGYHGVWTVDQARDEARKILVSVKNGIDPLSERKDVNNAKTVKDLCETYMVRHAKPHKKSWEKDQSHINRFIVPTWGTQKAMNIKQSDVFKLHSKIGETRIYEANRLLTLLSKMFNLAESWGYVPEGFKNPTLGIKKYKEEKRDRWITPAEMPLLAQAINEETNIYVSSAIWLYLYTGLRKTELLKAKWSDVNWDNKKICLRDNKSGQVHYVPLSEQAIHILKELPRYVGNEYILPGQKEGAHLVNIAKPWNRIRKKAAIEDVRLHDLRRTVGSWLAQEGSSLHLIGRVLNHASPLTTAGYAHFGEDHVRKALEHHSKLIDSAVNPPQDSHVIDLQMIRAIRKK